MGCKRFTVVVPLVVINEIKGLMRGQLQQRPVDAPEDDYHPAQRALVQKGEGGSCVYARAWRGTWKVHLASSLAAICELHARMRMQYDLLKLSSRTMRTRQDSVKLCEPFFADPQTSHIMPQAGAVLLYSRSNACTLRTHHALCRRNGGHGVPREAV